MNTSREGQPFAGHPLTRLTPRRVEGLYVHVPFCRVKCGYCDFYSVVGDAAAHRAFVTRLLNEARAMASFAAGSLRTVFVGGGTPTVLDEDLWREMLEGLRAAFDLSCLDEFTVEANPETVTPLLLDVLVAGGVDRLSLGAQSFHPRHLETLGRRHRPESVARAVTAAQAAGIDNLSLDLIYAVPGETLADWRADLDATVALAPEHVSCYALSFEPGTPLADLRAQRRVEPLDEDLEAAMYEAAIDRLAAAGFEHYEISNFAQPGRRCRHNLLYWTNANWLALGPAAAGHVDGLRWKNAPDLDAWLASRGPAPAVDVEQLDADARLGEELMLRLRLTEGLVRAEFEPRLDARRLNVIERRLADGLLESTPTHLRFTRRGLRLANVVLAEII